MANLILNPGFETAGGGGQDIWANWTENHADGIIADEGTIVHGGSHSCKMIYTGTGFDYVEQSVACSEGASYNLSIWVRGKYFVYLFSGGAQDYDTGDVGSTWTEVNLSVVTDDTTITVRVYTTFTGGHTAYFDDVTLEMSPSEGTLAETLDAFTLSATGFIDIEGTLDETLGAFTLSATGTGYSSVGVLDEALDAVTLAATGVVLKIIGVLEKTLDPFTLGATGGITHPAGWYSPGHPDALTGFGKGMKVKVEVDGTVKFVGRVASIRPTSGLFEYPTVEVEAHDWMGYLTDQELGIQTVAETKRVDEALTTVLADFPIQPESTSFGTGLETFLLIFDTESPKSSMASFLQKLCRNELGRIYCEGDGTLVFENRDARSLITTPDFDLDGIMTEFNVSYERRDVFNVIQAVINPVEASPNADVLLWDLKVAEYFGGVIPSIAAGETLVLECPFTDPALDISVTAINVVNPIEVIEFGSTADFESNNLIDYLDVTQVIGANKTIVSMTNTHGSTTGYLNDLQIYGRALYSYGSRTVESRDQTSIDSGIGERRFTLRLDEITDAIDALALATHVRKRYASSYARSRHIKFLANQSAGLLADAIAIEPSTRFTATETITGIDQDFYVNRVKYSIVGQQLWVDILADPVRPFISEGTLTRSLASFTLAGIGTVV